MKKILMLLILFVLAPVTLLAQTSTPPAAGDGSAGNPYQIATLDNLFWITQNSAEWNKNFIQTASIDATSTTNWDEATPGFFRGLSPIGTLAIQFTGSYDGQNFSISNLYIHHQEINNVGLFGRTNGATLSNIGLTNVNIFGQYNLGSLAGKIDGSSIISNCYSTGSVTGIDENTGGLVGLNDNSSTVSDSYSTCNVSSSGKNVGGLVGLNDNSSTINNSYGTGTVSVTGLVSSWYAGGLVGSNNNSSTVSNSYSTGDVSGELNYVGGFVGLNSGLISNCYSRGNVTRTNGTNLAFGGFCGFNSNSSAIEYSYSTGSVYVGTETTKGFVAEDSSGSYTSNFWDSEISNQTIGWGASSKTTTEMNTRTTFTGAGWDFTDETANGANDVWELNGAVNDGYLYLSWQIPAAEINVKQGVTYIADGGSYDYGNNTLGNNIDVVFTIENSGYADLTLTTPLSITGTHADQFSIQAQPTSPVPAGNDITFTVRFSPTSAGAKTASIAIANNDSTENPYNLTLDGTGIIPEINLKQSATDIADGGSYGYGNKASGTNTDVVFTIENNGTADLTLTTPITLGGANADQFSIQVQPSTPISASGDTTFTVRFSPTSAGAKTTTISIANNDSDENPYNLTLNGTGTVPEINLKQSTTDIADGGSYGYGSQASGSNSDVVFTIENTGTANLTLTTPLTLGGANADQFSIQVQPSTSISAPGNTTFTVQFSPTSAGEKTATISIANNDSDEDPYDLTLNGTGTEPEINLKQSAADIADGGSYGYGSQASGSNTDVVFTIENTGIADLTVTTPLTLSGANADQFSIQEQPSTSISATESTTFTVRFSPTSAGAKTATISIANNDSDEDPYDLTLNGTGTEPEINLKQSATDIADGGNYGYGNKASGSNTDIVFTIENTGIADLTVTTPLTLSGANADQFSIQEQPSTPISASGSTTFTIRFSPTSAGAKTAGIAIANNDSNENPYDLTLTGSGVVGTQPPGSGTSGDPYQISILDHLLWVSSNSTSWDKYFEQIAAIDASTTSTWNSDGSGGYYGFSPIGSNTIPFSGSYDGNGYTISNLYINRTATAYNGFFGVTSSATVKNIGLTNVNIYGYFITGALVGDNRSLSVISNCYSTGTISTNNVASGGLVGKNQAELHDCYSTCSVSSTGGGMEENYTHVGGLVGWNVNSALIVDSYSTGSVTGTIYIGGLVGVNESSSTITNCYSTGPVSSNSYSVGGFVGLNRATVNNCYSTGDVTRSSGFGTSLSAFCGTLWDGSIEYSYSTGSVIYSGATDPTDKGFVGQLSGSPTYGNNFWDNLSSNQSTATGATEKTTTEMKSLATFTDLATSGLSLPWDFNNNPNDDVANNDYWDIDLSGTDNAGYPYFVWQYPSGPEINVKQSTTDIADGGSYNFGNKTTGTNTDIVFTIENTGVLDLTLTTPLTITGTSADQFSVQIQPTSPVPGDDSTTFTIRFSPTSPGAKTASLSMVNNDSNENPYDLILNGTGTGPEINVKQSTTDITDGGNYNYGAQTTGTNTDIVFTIENNGTADLTLTTPLTITGTNADQFSVHGQPTSPVPGGGNTTFTIRFSPTSAGAKTASLSMVNNDSNENPYDLILNGTGTVPEMDLKQGTTPIADGGNYDYGIHAAGTNTDIVFTIENNGAADLTLTTPLTITGINADQFSIQSQPIPPVSTAGSTTFTIRFSPTSAGAKTASISIVNNDSDESPYDLILNGTGTAPEMGLKQGTTPIAAGGSYDYGNKTTDTNTDIIFTIENTGTSNLALTTPLTITGTNADQFSIQAQPASTVSTAGSTTFTVRFSPTSTGVQTATIAMANNDSDENPYDLTLIGNGTIPEMHLMQSTTDLPDGGSYDFGDIDAGSNTDVIFTIENFGAGSLTLTTPLTITGPDANQFSIQAQPTSPVSASGNTTFTVRFSPTSQGDKTASISIGNNDSDENPYNLTLNGWGAVPDIHLMQATFDYTDGDIYHYGSNDAGTDTDIVFTIENFGDGSLTLTTPLTITGTNADQFSIQAQPVSPVPAGENTTFTVRFSPTSQGTKTASIAIDNNDSDENPYDLILDGYGAIPEIDVWQDVANLFDGDDYQYGSKDAGTNTDVVFTIENDGLGALLLTTPLVVSGTNADQFSIHAQPVSPVPAGGSTTFTVRFSPTSLGNKAASIAIGNNDSDENPFDLILNGYGAISSQSEMNLKQSTTNINDGDSYIYENMNIGTHTDIDFTIENYGSLPLLVSTPLILSGANADQFIVLAQPAPIVSAGGSTTFTVRFSPTLVGLKTASIAIVNTDSDENPYDLTLNGTGTIPEMHLKQGIVDLADGDSHVFDDTDPGSNTDAIFTINNSGTGSLTLITPLTIDGTNADQFSIITQPTTPVSAAGNTTFTVRFSPTSEGNKTASIAIANNDNDENPYDLILNGYGTAAYPTYTVSTSVPAGKGSFNPTSSLVDYGQTTTFDVTVENGNTIATVTGCGGTWTGSNPYITGAITGDCTVTATLSKFPWTMFLPSLTTRTTP